MGMLGVAVEPAAREEPTAELWGPTARSFRLHRRPLLTLPPRGSGLFALHSVAHSFVQVATARLGGSSNRERLWWWVRHGHGLP